MQAAGERARIRIVQSRQNARVKRLRAAFAQGGLDDAGLIAVEGLHLLEEALRSRLTIDAVFLRSGAEALIAGLALPPSADVLELPPEVFASAVDTESPQGVAALVQAPSFSLEQLFHAPAPLLLVLAGLQDPGNLGTLLRSAEAFGANGVIALPGTVHAWNPKALRASSGSAFRVPLARMADRAALTLLRERRVRIAATVPRRGLPAQAANLRGPLALLIGNEGAGLSPAWIAAAELQLTIPCPGPVESLNAAIAGSLLLYEAARQRAPEIVP